MEISAIFEKNSLHFCVERPKVTIGRVIDKRTPRTTGTGRCTKSSSVVVEDVEQWMVAPIMVTSSYAASESPAVRPSPGSVRSPPASTSRFDTNRVEWFRGMEAEKAADTSNDTASATLWEHSGRRVLEEES